MRGLRLHSGDALVWDAQYRTHTVAQHNRNSIVAQGVGYGSQSLDQF
jgi:hypothetical protein